MKKFVILMPALLIWGALGLAQPALADGTETLGPPSIAIAAGSGVVSAGTGANIQPATINLAVPAGSQIKQVLAYWEGESFSGSTPSDAPGDATININAASVTGTLIGGPTEFFVDQSQFVDASSYRADITALNLVTPGNNTLTITGMDFSYANEGASIVVIFDDGSGPAVIGVRDGIDLAWKLFDEPKKTTVPQTFTFPAAGVTRTGQMHLAIGSVEEGRIASVKITAGPIVVTHVLSSADGKDWDNPVLPVTILPGVASATVEVISGDQSSTFESASLAWVNAIFALTGEAACPTTPGVRPTTHGSAYGADVSALNLHPLNKVGNVSTQAPDGPTSQGKNLLNIGLPGIVSAKVISTQSNSSLTPSPNSTASATVADVNLLSGAITSATVRGVSQSVASPNGASYNSNGSTFENLRINGVPVVNVAPNTTVLVKNPLAPSQTLAEAHLYEESGTSSASGGAYTAGHSVNMIRVVLLQPFLTLPKGAEIVISHADSDARSPQTTCPAVKSVSGEAFTALSTTRLAGNQIAQIKVGTAALPPTGGSNSDGTNANLPGLARSSTAANTTSGSLSPNPNATSRSIVEGANVLNGLVTAQVLDVRSSSSANGTTAATTFDFTFLELKVDGVTVTGTVAPNTTIAVPLPGGGFARVVLNERVVNSNGTTDTEGTINAVHVVVFGPGGLVQEDVIVASAHSDAHV